MPWFMGLRYAKECLIVATDLRSNSSAKCKCWKFDEIIRFKIHLELALIGIEPFSLAFFKSFALYVGVETMYRAFQNLPRLLDFLQAICCNLQLIRTRSPGWGMKTPQNSFRWRSLSFLQVRRQVLPEESGTQVEVQAFSKRAGWEGEQGESGWCGRDQQKAP